MANKTYFFDYASTTPLDKRVLSSMLPYLKEEFGNPSNLYKLGRSANRAVALATETITNILGCRLDEFVYTSSATEADNLAILGTARANKENGSKIIVSQIEHKGILAVCDVLEKEGFEVVRLPVLKNGLVDLNELKKELDDKTILVSVTMADSETGTIQPISEISKIIKNFRSEKGFPYFQTDASQAAKYLNIDVNKLGVDLMTLSAHKIYGPKGIGGLYVRKGTNISPIIYGGGQQGSLRSGTENVPGIVGFAKALSLCKTASSAVRQGGGNKKKEFVRIKKMRDILERGLFKSIPKVVLNGHPKLRLPNFLNISILDIEGEAMILCLDELGIMAATGSACNSQSLEPSYILSALGNPYEFVHGSIRFTLGKGNDISHVKYVLKHLPAVVKRLRDISPLNLKTGQTKAISNPRAFIGKQTPHFLKKHK